MINIHYTLDTKTIVVNGNLMDEHKVTEKTITFLGIKVWHRKSIANADLRQAVLQQKQLGFNNQSKDEKA